MEPLWLLVTFLTLLGLSLLAWSLKALDLPGAILAFLLGSFVALQGGLLWLILMTMFTAVGVVVTAIGRKRKFEAGLSEDAEKERSWRNVVANGAAPGLAVAALWVVEPTVAAMAFATAVAAATSDTTASELGCLAPKARNIVPPFQELAPGVNGGVSMQGQVAALGGAALIGFSAMPLLGLSLGQSLIVVLAGFLGCQLDSILGATLERDEIRDRPLGKADVNFIAAAVPAFVVLVVAALVGV